MRQIKYLFLGALLTIAAAPAHAQVDGNAAVAQVKSILENGNSAAADKEIANIAKPFKKDAVVLTAIGREYYIADNMDKAEEYANLARTKDKTYGEAYILLGDIAIHNDDGGKAAEWFQQAMHMDSKNPEGYRRYAILMTVASPDAALNALAELKANVPSYPTELIAAEVCDRSGDIKTAVEYYAKVPLADMEERQLASYGADLLLTGDYAKSLEVAQYGVKKNPRHAAFNRLSLYNFTETEQYDQALAFGEKLFNASDSAKITAYDYQYLGHANVGAKKYDAAIKAFETILTLKEEEGEEGAINLADAKIDALEQIASVYTEMEDYVKAIPAYRKFLDAKVGPTATDYAGLGTLYLLLANEQEGEAREKTVAEGDKVYADLAAKFEDAQEYAYNQRATLAMLIDPDLKKGAAKPHYDKLIEVIIADSDPDERSLSRLVNAYRYNISYAWLILDDLAAAKGYAAKILEIIPDDEQATAVIELK